MTKKTLSLCTLATNLFLFLGSLIGQERWYCPIITQSFIKNRPSFRLWFHGIPWTLRPESLASHWTDSKGLLIRGYLLKGMMSLSLASFVSNSFFYYSLTFLCYFSVSFFLSFFHSLLNCRTVRSGNGGCRWRRLLPSSCPFPTFLFGVKLSYWLTIKKFQFVQIFTSLVCVTGGKKRHSLYVVPQE